MGLVGSFTHLFVIFLLACSIHLHEGRNVLNRQEGNDILNNFWFNGLIEPTYKEFQPVSFVAVEGLAVNNIGITSVNPKPAIPACIRDCGVANKVTARIVGGERAAIQAQPWMVGLQVMGYQGCGGALVNHCFVLTASHCFKKVSSAGDVIAILGTGERYTFDAQRIPIAEIFRHPEYLPNQTHHDIALLKLATPVEFNNRIHPVCLPAKDESYLGQLPTVIGFGFTRENGTSSNYLNEVSVRVIDHDKCAKIFEEDATIYSQNLCAGGDEGKDACLGDSGSPLIKQDNEMNTIIGSVSWGIGCARRGVPGVYTRTAAYLPWIHSVISESGCCDA